MRNFAETLFDSRYRLDGPALAEAAAGTGKTYQIQNVYLRLIVAEGLSADQILVVTFTEAATRELRERLRQILAACDAFLHERLPKGHADYDRVRRMAALPLRRRESAPDGGRDDDMRERQRRVRRALADFDCAAIHTIHGFCHRVLERYAFECGHDPDAELLADNRELLGEICRDWWRARTYADAAQAAAMPFRDVGELLADVAEALQRPDAELRGAEPEGAAAMIRDLRDRVQQRIRERRLLTYDQMLLGVRDALRDPRRQERLLAVLRDDFRAALIDEFQDTDPIQYEIFHTLFADSGHPLLFVGDPKQAIYGFRGGDIFTYYDARRDVDAARVHLLDTNYRSETNLVAAVNELFDGPPDRPGAFLNEHIRYQAVRASGLPDEKTLTRDGQPLERPLIVRRYALPPRGRFPGQNSPLARHLYRRTAAEIVGLLGDPALRRGGRPLRRSDIAVLTTTHQEAQALHDELHALGVRATLQKSGNVFDSDEADALRRLMAAWIAPGHAGATRAALCAEIMPCDERDWFCYRPEPTDGAADVPCAPAADDRPQRTLDDWMTLFSRAGTLWKKRSFVEAFGCVEREIAWRAHIAGLADGERKLTNLLHLADLAHQVARERHWGPESLLRWFGRQMDEASREQDENQTVRLCSDEDAVNIMTVFKSKGLEFPVVFAPTLWRRTAKPVKSGGATRFLAYHEEVPDGPSRMILDLDLKNDVALEKARRENLEEDVRLAYVALTRAASRVCLYAVTGGGGDSGERALNRLLDERWSAATDHIEKETVAEEDWPAAERAAPAARPAAADAARLRERGRPRVDRQHGHTSFSALVRAPGAFERDRDQSDNYGTQAPAAATTDIFAIPGGARTGDCWHDLLETLDFTAPPDIVAQTVDAALDRTRICRDAVPAMAERKRRAVHDMIGRLLTTPIRTAAASFRLNQVPAAARHAEMGFHFSLKQSGAPATLGDLRTVLDRHWRSPARDEDYLADLADCERALPLGIMSGFMDALFCHEGRFYIVDWKSNMLSGRADGFGGADLQKEMRRHGYYLQYMIYAVATDAFLRRRLADYCFDRHFGGVLYLFLRGVDGATQSGVYYDPLAAALVENLSRAFVGGRDGGEP